MTQKTIIKKLCQDQPEKWFFSYEFVKANTKYGWLGTSGDRRARELAELGILEREDDGQYTRYRLTQHTLNPDNIGSVLAQMEKYRPEVIASKMQKRLI